MRKFIFGLIAVLAILIVSYFSSYHFMVTKKLDLVSPTARPSVDEVLKAYYWSKLTGDYWENNMLAQTKSVAEMKLQDRLEFYRSMILYCDLDTSRAVLFEEMVGDDKQALKEHLKNYSQNQNYEKLTQVEQKKLAEWSQ